MCIYTDCVVRCFSLDNSDQECHVQEVFVLQQLLFSLSFLSFYVLLQKIDIHDYL